MQKLTLSVDPRVIERAKRYARARGTSVSRLVEQMLDLAATGTLPADAAGASGGGPVTAPPVLARLRGSLRRGSRDDYRRYLAKKYR